MALYIFIGFIIGLAGTYYVMSLKRTPKFLASAEYWVYLRGEKLPDQSLMMDRMIGKNPYARAGQSPIGRNEGLVFSDIRLHIALVLKAKNPHAFRPDLFESHVEPTAEILAELGEAKSFVKVRYISEEPLKDKRHIQFLAHAADAISELGGGSVIFDVTEELLMSRANLSRQLSENSDATRPEMHVRTVWQPGTSGGVVQTRGLKKIGLSELTSNPIETDERMIASNVLEEAAYEVWKQGTLPESVQVTAFDDQFKVVMQPLKDGMVPVRLLRVQAT